MAPASFRLRSIVFGLFMIVAMLSLIPIAFADADTTAPTISTVTDVTNPSSTASPSYTFTTNEAGQMALTGGCASGTTMATNGSNTISFNALANGTYECALTVTDAAGNVSNSQPIHFVVNVPTATVAPTISGITVSNITSNTADVSWSTNADASGQVIYGVNTYYGAMSNATPANTMNQSTRIYGLIPGTQYHFYVISQNAGGTASSTDQTFTTLTDTSGGGGNSTTTATTTDAALALTGVDTISNTAVPGGGFGSGWKWVLHFTVPNNETSFNLKLGDFTSGNNTIPAGGNIRFYSSDSSTATSTGSAITLGSANTYSTSTLNLNNDLSSSTPGRQVDVTVEVQVPSGTPAGSYSTTFFALSTTTTP